QDLRDAHRLRPAWLGIVDPAVGDLDLVREREARGRRNEPFGERAGDRHELEGRARLVGVGDGAVALEHAPDLWVVVRVETRRGRHLPNGASGRVEDDRGRALRVPAEDGVAQDGLRVRLDRVVGVTVYVAPVAHGLRDDGVDRLARGVFDDPLAAGPSSQLAVERELEAGQAAVVEDRRAADLPSEEETPR